MLWVGCLRPGIPASGSTALSLSASKGCLWASYRHRILSPLQQEAPVLVGAWCPGKGTSPHFRRGWALLGVLDHSIPDPWVPQVTDPRTTEAGTMDNRDLLALTRAEYPTHFVKGSISPLQAPPSLILPSKYKQNLCFANQAPRQNSISQPLAQRVAWRRPGAAEVAFSEGLILSPCVFSLPSQTGFP